MTTTTGTKKPNNLINESSPYLLQHAYNPVNWYAWGEAALKKAKEEDKPILVSIGYSACHWCHVMERECFELEEIAELMNEHFINIKVDREERPDVDQIYMEALQTMNIRGGWPLNVFLTSEAKPFYGGTYFPPSHWVNLLQQIAAAYKNNRKELEDSAAEFTKAINHSELDKYGLNKKEHVLSGDDIDPLFVNLEKRFDSKWGGTGNAPKFPMPSVYLFLLRYYHISGKEEALRHVKLTLEKMAWGGIYDQAGGGFARYSTDEEWFAPHFEKMLYDNAQLLSLYSEAYAVTQDSLYKDVVYETVKWLNREMTSNEGAFYSALDADSEGEEGKFYVWTFDELKELFGNDAELFCDYYTITQEGNWEHGYNILIKSLSDTAFANKHKLDKVILLEKVKEWKALLMQRRSCRIRPGLDDKILTSWNGMMLKGLTDAYRIFDEPAFLQLAEKNANFIKDKMSIDGKLLHNYKNGRATIEGYLEDYAFVINGYINLYEATFNEAWLQEAKKLTDYALEHFWDTKEELFYFTAGNSEKLIARKKELFDNVIPASNSVMAHNLFKLGLLFENEDYYHKSESMLAKVQPIIVAEPSYLSNWASLYTCFVTTTHEIAITGKDYLQFRTELDKHYLPNKILAGAEKESNLPLLQGRMATDKTTVFVCYNKTCKLPVQSVKEAIELIEK